MGTILALATIWTIPFGVWNLDEADFEWGKILGFVAVCVLGVVGTGLAYWIMGSLIARVGGTGLVHHVLASCSSPCSSA